MGILHFFLISILPVAIAVGLVSAVTKDNPTTVSTDPSTGLYQSTTIPDGKIDQIILTFDGPLEPSTAFSTDFEVTGYRVLNVTGLHGQITLTLNLALGDVQDTGATPLVKFYPGRLQYSSDGTTVSRGTTAVNVTASDGAAPVLDLSTGQALFRPNFDSNGNYYRPTTDDTNPGTVFMSFSERVNVNGASPLNFMAASAIVCDSSTVPQVALDGQPLTSTSHVTLPSLCEPDAFNADGFGISAQNSNLDAFAQSIKDSQQLSLLVRPISQSVYYFAPNYDSSVGYGIGNTFDEATMLFLIGNPTICNRGSTNKTFAGNVTFQCTNATAPIRPRVTASSLDLDGNGVIDTIQVRTLQDRLGYITQSGFTGKGWSLGDGNFTYLNGPRNRSDVRIDTYVPNSTLSSWTLPGYTITGVTSERGRILLNVTPSNSSVSTTAISGTLNYAGGLTTWTGNILNATNIAVSDKACPVIVSVMGYGGATNMTITFSEPLTDATVLSTSFVSLVATTFNAAPFTQVSVTSPGVYVASFTSPLIYKNFGGSLPVQISGLPTISQASGICPLRRSYVTLASLDTTPPGLLSVFSRDRNGNGRIDGFSVYFNKSITDETVVASNFSVGGFAGLAVVASTLNDSIVDFNVTETSTINTTLLTSFAYAASTLVDLSNNPLAPFSVTTLDGVGPYPLSLQTGNTYPSSPSLDKIVIQFSEPVTGTLLGSDFVITNPSITPDIAVAVSGSTVTLHFSSVPFSYASSTPQVAYTNRTGADSNGNLIPSFALPAVDRIRPICGPMAKTQDLDGDGRIDTIYLACTEALMNISLTSFTVENYTVILAATSTQTIFTGAVTINLTVQEKSFYDTGATPRVNYNASSLVTDLAGNSLQGPFPVQPTDEVPPVVVSILTQDLNRDGKIDAFQVTFSENVAVNSIGKFSIMSYAITGYSLSGPILIFNASATPISIYDGGATPSLTYSAPSSSTDVTDVCTLCSSPNKLPAFVKQSLDGVFPIVLSALTAGSCKLQAVQISMNEDINLTSVNISSFSIPGYTITNVSLGGVFPYGFSLIVSPYPLLISDIVTPNVTYSAPLSVVDNNANPMVAFNMVTQDKLAPCMVSCAGHVGGSYVAIIFSEPVLTGTSSALTSTNFQLLSSSNAISSLNSTSNTTFFLSLNATFFEGDINFNSSDNKASIKPQLIHDANSNNATASCLVMNDDFVQPNLFRVSTVNTNDADLQIDSILLQFDKHIEDSTMDITAWNVGGYTITNFSTGATVNDQFISLILNPKTVPDTGATPVVSYTRPAIGGFADRNRNPLNSTSMTALDNAKPILVTFAATIFYSGNIAVATFSEPVYGNSNGSGLLDGSSFVYNSTNGNAASIQMFQDANGSDGQVSMVLNTLALTDFNNDSVLALAFDKAGNKCVAKQVNVTKGDTVPPVFVSADTQDLDYDGQIDHLFITFNDSVLPSTFSLSNFSLAGYTLSNVVVNDTTATFAVNQSGGFDGAATPVFKYTPGVVSDLNGNLLGAFSNSTRDRVAPFLIDCSSTLPNITTIDCLFSEAVSAPSSGSTAFTLAGPLVRESVVSTLPNGSMVTLSLNEVLVLSDFKKNGTVNLTVNGLTDLAGNFGLQHQVFLRNTDVTPPVVLDAKTADRDCDGFIDHIVVQFNEGIIDANVNFSDFTLGGGYVIDGKDNELPLDDNWIYLRVQKQPTSDTDVANFTLTYTPGTLTDLSDNLAMNFTHNVRDGTGVALLNVTGNVDAKKVFLQFSGPFSANSDISQLILQNFSSSKLSLLDPDGSDGNLTLFMTESLLPIDFETPASIFPFVVDQLGNPACYQAVPLTNPDHTAPTVISVATNDEDSDGRIDGFIFTCSENIDELSLRATDFTVGSYTVIGISGFPVSNLFKLSVAEKNGTDASVTPVVSYNSGSLTDRYGNKLASFANKQSVDRIGPAIISATAVDSTLTLLFSKPLFNATNGTMFNLSDVTYTANANGTAPNAITSIADSQGTDSVLSFGMVRAFTAADFASAYVSGGTKRIFDAHGNALNSTARVKIFQGPAAASAAPPPGLTDTQVIGIAVGCGGGLLLLILVAVLVVVCKKKGWACFKKDDTVVEEDQGGFDFGGYGAAQMTQSSKGAARLEA